jgi:crotonobetainyl-CoA:carnitine CoA-transferase CaiB-like acyl-CoA transferase
MPGPLTGVRILEIAKVDGAPDVATAWACQILGDLGADVIKVEPSVGTDARRAGAFKNTPDMAATHLIQNRNKRSLVIDIKKSSGRNVLLKLAGTAGAVVHANPQALMTKWGLDHAAFKAANPRIVTCAATGYGTNGPYAGRATSEETMQAVSSITSLNAAALARTPCYTPTLICEKTVAMTMVSAVVAALFHAQQTGQGQEVEVPAFETMAAYLMIEHMWGESFIPPNAKPGYPGVLSPQRKLTPTKDGYISILTYMHWDTFCRLAGRPELAEAPRFRTLPDRMKHIDALYDETTRIMATRTTQEWLDVFGETSMPITAVNDLNSLMDDPHLATTGYWKTVNHPTEGALRLPAFPANYSLTPAEIRRPPPGLGEHSREILMEAGISPEEAA